MRLGVVAALAWQTPDKKWRGPAFPGGQEYRESDRGCGRCWPGNGAGLAPGPVGFEVRSGGGAVGDGGDEVGEVGFLRFGAVGG